MRAVAKAADRNEEVRPRRFRPYPEYRASDIEWLGAIPAHWHALSLKRVCRLSYGESLAADDRVDGDAVVFGSNGPVGTHNRTNTEAPCLIVGRKGSFGKVNYSADAVFAIDTTFVTDKRYTDADLRWLFYTLQCARLDRVSKDSAIPGLDREDAYAFVTAVGPIDEQRAIAAFLDRETAKIDVLMAKKERLIELLQEKRTALITRAVTRGLDPNVPMKDSGEKYLREVPKHWEEGALSRWWTVLDCKHRTVPFLDDGVAVASIGEVHGLKVDLSNANRTSISEYQSMIEGGRKPQVGDIIYSRNATVGEAAIVNDDEPFCMGQDVSLIRGASSQPLFLLHLLRSRVVAGQLEALMVGSTFKRINVGQIKKFIVPVPPKSEQDDIAQYSQNVYDTVHSLIERVQIAIERLNEYRTALISAAVTGKIDVRKEAE